MTEEEQQQEQTYSESEVNEMLFRNTEAQKETAHSFFTKVIQQEDSTKIGNLNTEELGISRLPVRTYKELSLFCTDVCDEKEWGSFFKDMGEIQLGTSLSKEGFLLKQVGTSRKEIADMTPKQKVKKGFFKKQNNEQPVSAY